MGFQVAPKTELEPWAREALAEQQVEAAPAEDKFEYILSPLALEYDRGAKIEDHVAFIRQHPELRDQVLIGAAEFDPELAEAVRGALAQQAPAEAPPAAEATAAETPAQTVEPAAQVEQFEYILSPLALEYDRGQKVIDHVDYIRNNPALRDAVLSGAAEFDPQLAHDVQVALEHGVNEPPAVEVETTPPEVVEAAAEQAVPTAATGETTSAEVAPEPEPVPEPGWVTRARAFHDRHPELAAQFNEITGGACLGPDGTLDPNLVATWQVDHDVPPDGRVGEATLGAAILQPPTWAEAAEQAEKDGEEIPDVLDPRFAL